MDLTAAGYTPELDDIMLRAKECDLEEYLLDLVMYGYTIVPAEALGTAELTGRLRTAILNVFEQRTGQTIDDAETFDKPLASFNPWGWLLTDETFVESLYDPAFQAIGQYLTGKSGFVSGSAALLQTSQTTPDIPLQRDTLSLPTTPFPLSANIAWLLTDTLSMDDGPTVIKPGRRVGKQDADDHPIPLFGKAGSLVIWDSTIWHQTIPRKRPGVGITLIHNWQRVHMRRLENEQEVPSKFLERWPDLVYLLGHERIFPVEETLIPEHAMRNFLAMRDQHA